MDTDFGLFPLPFTRAQYPTPMLRARTPLCCWHLTVGTTSLSATRPPGNSFRPLSSCRAKLCAPLWPSPAAELWPSRRGTLYWRDVPICWPLHKTDRYKWHKCRLEIGHSCVISNSAKAYCIGFGAHRQRHHTSSLLQAVQWALKYWFNEEQEEAASTAHAKTEHRWYCTTFVQTLHVSL